MSQIILFDIDNTLIDTFKLASQIDEQIISNYSIPRDNFISAKNEYYSQIKVPTRFNPQNYCAHIATSFNLDLEKIETIFNQSKYYINSLFPGTKLVLSQLSIDNKLGIFSEGYEDFQIKKLKLSGIYSYFIPSLFFIFSDKLKEANLTKLPTGSLIIDDKLSVVKKISNFKNLDILLIDRKNNITNQKNMVKIDSLTYIKNYIK